MKLIETKTDNQPRLGNLVYQAPANWKISMLAEAGENSVCGIYDNVSRRDSKLVINGQMHPQAFNAETIGQPIVFGQYVVAAGECGHLIYGCGNQIRVHDKVPLKWATSCALYRGMAVVIDSDGKKNRIKECVTGQTIGYMPGQGIAMAAVEHGGLLWAAEADADNGHHGVCCSDGREWNYNACMCIIEAWGILLFSAGNKIYRMDAAGPDQVGELPCEKIMHMVMVGDKLRIAGANPDTAWEANCHGNVTTIGVLNEGNKEVGGSCFRVRISEHYFARAWNGVTGQVYEIKIGGS